LGHYTAVQCGSSRYKALPALYSAASARYATLSKGISTRFRIPMNVAVTLESFVAIA